MEGEMAKKEGACEKGGCQRLSICGLGIALGVSWAIGMLVMGIFWKLGYGGAMMSSFSSMYVGLAATPIGILIGMIWAFIDGFIGGVIIAWIYNKVIKLHHCKVCCTHKEEK